ncbi:flagellar motor switch protein FliM [Gluconobacter wancherniae]
MNDDDFPDTQFPAASMAMPSFADDGGEAGRILNQEEIDSLFGGSPEDASQSGSGLERLIGAPYVSYERLPMLEVVFDRLVRILTTSMRNFTSDNVDLSMDRLNSQRFGDYLESVSDRAMFAVFKAEEWDNYGLLVLNSSLIYTVVDALLGGHTRLQANAVATPRVRQDSRSHTTIERALIEPLIEIVLNNLAESFSPLCAVNFRFERLELSSRFAAISRAANGVVMARFSVDMAGRGGDMDLILPHATLEPVRETLLQQFMGEKFGHDEIWESHLARELWQTEVTLDAVLEEQTMNLQDIISLSPGDQLVFRPNSGGRVQLRCGGTPMFTAKVGRAHGHVAVRIEETTRRTASGNSRTTSYS